MNIVMAYSHHPRCGPWYHARAFRQLGHAVTTVGPWNAQTPFGTHGREPNVQLPERNPPHYAWDELGVSKPDVFVLAEGGEDLRVLDVPVPWVHFSTEGTNLAWSDTPHKFYEIGCNGVDPSTATWLPKAFDVLEHVPPTRVDQREYDLVQLASAREARRYIWQQVEATAPDLHCLFGDVWGPCYAAAYQSALATYVCSTKDFVTTRVFEAMAMRCVVIADRNPATLALFNEGEHFIGFDPIPGPGGEGMPDPNWLIDTVRRLRRGGVGDMAHRAGALVWQRDSYQHRVVTMLQALGFK